MKPISDLIAEKFNLRTIVEAVLERIPNFLSAVAILFFFWLFWRIARKTADMIIQKLNLDPTAANFLQTVLKYTLLTIGIVTALGRVGINTASILASLGVAGLTIGFAAKDALSNMISGIMIFWDRPFVIGDLVEIDGLYGRVSDITMRSTRVVTVDGRMLAVPNSTIINTTVASYTNFPHLRLDIPFTIGVNEDLSKSRKIALDLCSETAGFMASPTPEVVVTSLNDYNIAMELHVWIDDEKNHIALRAALKETLFEALRKNQVDMPFETITIHSAV